MHLMCVLVPSHLLTEPGPLDAFLLASTLERAARKKIHTLIHHLGLNGLRNICVISGFL